MIPRRWLQKWDAPNQRIPDDQVLADAAGMDRCVVTFNRDDFFKLHRSGAEHNGIIVFKNDMDYSEQTVVLQEYLITQQSLKNRFIRVLKQNQRGSSFPICIVKEYQRFWKGDSKHF